MPPTQPERERKLQHREIIVRRTSKWGSFGERVAKLKEGESIVLQPEGDPSEEACKIRSGLNRIRACRFIRARGAGRGRKDCNHARWKLAYAERV